MTWKNKDLMLQLTRKDIDYLDSLLTNEVARMEKIRKEKGWCESELSEYGLLADLLRKIENLSTLNE